MAETTASVRRFHVPNLANFHLQETCGQMAVTLCVTYVTFSLFIFVWDSRTGQIPRRISTFKAKSHEELPFGGTNPGLQVRESQTKINKEKVTCYTQPSVTPPQYSTLHFHYKCLTTTCMTTQVNGLATRTQTAARAQPYLWCPWNNENAALTMWFKQTLWGYRYATN